ncbi:hypothetical protein KCP73_18855 [Salmonella enterica subsp. enterica]|nr:hypothetical protein KCP73_18855 [Salmonella enterica subsp. enterica]
MPGPLMFDNQRHGMYPFKRFAGDRYTRRSMVQRSYISKFSAWLASGTSSPRHIASCFAFVARSICLLRACAGRVKQPLCTSSYRFTEEKRRSALLSLCFTAEVAAIFP